MSTLHLQVRQHDLLLRAQEIVGDINHAALELQHHFIHCRDTGGASEAGLRLRRRIQWLHRLWCTVSVTWLRLWRCITTLRVASWLRLCRVLRCRRRSWRRCALRCLSARMRSVGGAGRLSVLALLSSEGYIRSSSHCLGTPIWFDSNYSVAVHAILKFRSGFLRFRRSRSCLSRQ